MRTNQPRPMSIFLADDDKDDCIFFEDALREITSGCDLVTSHDGKELMTILDRTVPPPPDVIFLDLNMPRKNGYECLKEIRTTPKLQNIPVIVFTTSTDSESINKMYHLGANRYISKPGSFPKLKKLIGSVLSLDSQSLSELPSRDNFVLNI